MQLTLHYRQAAKEIRGVREGGDGRREGGKEGPDRGAETDRLSNFQK